VQELVAVAGWFRPQACILDVCEYGSGNLNDTYLVTCDAERDRQFILQRINTHVFRHPERIMLNMRTLSEHVLARQERESPDAARRWEVPRVFAARDGQDYAIDDLGSFWRAISFVAHSRCYQTVQSVEHAREAGYALGRFHDLISDLDPDVLYDTLEGFHVTPRYLAHYDQVLEAYDAKGSATAVREGMQFVSERRDWASVLEDARARGELALRPIHGDPKINNFMIDETTGHAVSLIDLDTVKPGLVHYDIGDCLRSCCNPLGEETQRIDDVCFDLDLCRAILAGYLSQARRFLTAYDYAYLYDAVRLIAFELGLRFYTDHLEGDVYFKVRYPGHNLNRALVQFKVCESIETQEGQIRGIIEGLRNVRRSAS
jgi:Ser/Thr protein kinase RdoA (MazF antagonist)